MLSLKNDKEHLIAPERFFDRYVKCSRSPKCFLKYAKWEENHNQLALAREVYERSLRELNPKVYELDSIFMALRALRGAM